MNLHLPHRVQSLHGLPWSATIEQHMQLTLRTKFVSSHSWAAADAYHRGLSERISGLLFLGAPCLWWINGRTIPTTHHPRPIRTHLSKRKHFPIGYLRAHEICSHCYYRLANFQIGRMGGSVDVIQLQSFGGIDSVTQYIFVCWFVCSIWPIDCFVCFMATVICGEFSLIYTSV